MSLWNKYNFNQCWFITKTYHIEFFLSHLKILQLGSENRIDILRRIPNKIWLWGRVKIIIWAFYRVFFSLLSYPSSVSMASISVLTSVNSSFSCEISWRSSIFFFRILSNIPRSSTVNSRKQISNGTQVQYSARYFSDLIAWNLRLFQLPG